VSCTGFGPLGHDYALEPTDDAVAALQHEVALTRALHKELDASDVGALRAFIIEALGGSDFYQGNAVQLPAADTWLKIASAAMRAFEFEKGRGG
jgi:hypothetical protein